MRGELHEHARVISGEWGGTQLLHPMHINVKQDSGKAQDTDPVRIGLPGKIT